MRLKVLQGHGLNPWILYCRRFLLLRKRSLHKKCLNRRVRYCRQSLLLRKRSLHKKCRDHRILARILKYQ